jgi:hypothetical protein
MATPTIQAALGKGVIKGIRSLGFDEAYIEKFIEDDPSVLGLGDDISVVESQRHQEKGRLDLLLQDGARERRFELDLMLGNVDESHLIRTIEYWDIERRRYPAYDHCAVLVAENITARFLNVITLFSGSIPIIALQVNAIAIGEKVGLCFIRVVDSTKLRFDDVLGVAATKSSDRAAWLAYAGSEIIGVVDSCVAFINQAAKHSRTLNFNKQFIGLADNGKANNFVYFLPNKSSLWIGVNVNPVEPWMKKIEDAGLEFRNEDGRIRVKVTPKTFAENKDLIRELLQCSVAEDEQ